MNLELYFPRGELQEMSANLEQNSSRKAAIVGSRHAVIDYCIIIVFEFSNDYLINYRLIG